MRPGRFTALAVATVAIAAITWTSSVNAKETADPDWTSEPALSSQLGPPQQIFGSWQIAPPRGFSYASSKTKDATGMEWVSWTESKQQHRPARGETGELFISCSDAPPGAKDSKADIQALYERSMLSKLHWLDDWKVAPESFKMQSSLLVYGKVNGIRFGKATITRKIESRAKKVTGKGQVRPTTTSSSGWWYGTIIDGKELTFNTFQGPSADAGKLDALFDASITTFRKK